MPRWKLAFVVPRYGEQILGGAETLIRGFAEQSAAAGLAEVEVFTTCAVNHHTWQNDLPAGTTQSNGVTLHRFPMGDAGPETSRDFKPDLKHDLKRDLKRYIELQGRLTQDDVLNVDEQLEWIEHSAHSPELYRALARRAREFDFVFFAPYLFGTTFYGQALCADRAILWPCLHDEPYAYLDIVRDLFTASLGLAFNTRPEMALAERLYGTRPGQHVMGMGMVPPPVPPNAERFRQKYGLHEPFLLYAGRLERPKNVEVLIDYFIQYKRDHKRDHKKHNGASDDLKLVLMGKGPVTVATHPDVIQLGFMSEADKLDAYAAARVLCQPSLNESLSIVIMEAWLCGTPVLVHGNCAVTRHQVTQSNGGLYFTSYEEFDEAVRLLTEDNARWRTLARNGRRYVETVYNWPAVLARFEAALLDWQALRADALHADALREAAQQAAQQPAQRVSAL